MEQMFEQYQLTDAERDDARRRATQKLLADHARQPDRAEFAGYAVSQYPAAFTIAVGVVLVVVALAAGTISGIRLYFAGRDYAAETIMQPALTWVIGGATVLAAELLVILATVAAQVYMRGWRRGLSLIPVAVGMIVAFVGNWEVSQPSTTWGYVETLFPPIAVLSVAFFFEVSLMPELERRTANEKAYQEALAGYNELRARPDQHPDYRRYLARELWQQWVEVFREQVRIADVPIAERRQIVQRELGAESWLDDAAEFSVNSVHSTRQPGVSAVDQVVQHLRDNPAVFEGLQANSIPQVEVAAQLGVSQSSVSRGLNKVLKNGHGDTT